LSVFIVWPTVFNMLRQWACGMDLQ